MLKPDMSVWQGRVDDEGPSAVRWHQRVQPCTSGAAAGIALVGFACDEGVRRNHGRPGAAAGPRVIRQALANLAWHHETPVYDAGDIVCAGHLEESQERLASAVAAVIEAGHRPLVLGGGHETAWGTFLGVTRARPAANLGIINLDAHFDLRPGPPTSGTAFAQMADWYAKHERRVRYCCLGIAEHANTAALFGRAQELGATWLRDVDLRESVPAQLDEFLRDSDIVYLSVDLDVLPATVIPAVSAPAARGVPLTVIELLIAHIVASGKLAAADIVELCPALDQDGHAARTAALLAWNIARHWSVG